MRYAVCDAGNVVVNVIELPVPDGGGITVYENGLVTIRDSNGTQVGTYSVTAGHSLVADADAEADIGKEFEDGAFVDNRAAAAPRTCTPLQFIERFTPQEQAAIIAASKQSDALNLWLIKAVGAQEIDLDGARAIAGMQAMVDAGLITSERRDQILS